MSIETSSEYAAAFVDLINALEEWKDAGADVATVAGAINVFVHAICAQREEAGNA